MRERFRAHRGTLEQVVSLFRSNPALWLLIDDTARGEDGREIHDLHHLGAVLSRSSFPAKAGRDREAHARGVFAVVFPADAAGVVISDAEKGIVYLDTPPTKLRKDLDTRWVGDCDSPCYVPIEGPWYIYVDYD